MEVKAKHSFIRITPRKLRLVTDLVRGKGVNEALLLLKYEPRKRAAELVSRVLKSAVANADNKGSIDVDTLYVKAISVNQGPTLKRFRPVCKGGAHRILKRTSHLNVCLDER